MKLQQTHIFLNISTIFYSFFKYFHFSPNLVKSCFPFSTSKLCEMCPFSVSQKTYGFNLTQFGQMMELSLSSMHMFKWKEQNLILLFSCSLWARPLQRFKFGMNQFYQWFLQTDQFGKKQSCICMYLTPYVSSCKVPVDFLDKTKIASHIVQQINPCDLVTTSYIKDIYFLFYPNWW